MGKSGAEKYVLAPCLTTRLALVPALSLSSFAAPGKPVFFPGTPIFFFFNLGSGSLGYVAFDLGFWSDPFPTPAAAQHLDWCCTNYSKEPRARKTKYWRLCTPLWIQPLPSAPILSVPASNSCQAAQTMPLPAHACF